MQATSGRGVVLAGLLSFAVLAGCTASNDTSTTPGTGTGSSSVGQAPNPSTSTPSASTGSTAPSTATAPSTGTDAPAPTASGPVPPAVLAFSPASGSTQVSPTAPVQVTVSHGTLTAVSLTNAAGTTVAGSLSADKATWLADEPLGYGKDYELATTVHATDGKTIVKSASFSTVTPDNVTMPYLDTTAGLSIKDGATYGVGMVVSTQFDEPIRDKAAAEKALTVTTTPAAVGSWYWVNDQEVHWRPRSYYAAGTKVTVKAAVYGKNLGNGLYGEADQSIHFTIGQKHVSIADDKTHHVKVYFADKLVRDMPTSMGKGGTQQIHGRTISYWTQRGTYTVIGHDNPKIMDSRTYGLPLDKGGYLEPVNWATRISTDGVYLHELLTTLRQQGHRNMSHGCLNLNTANSKWFYKSSLIGDVVQVEHTGGAPLEVWQNGDWSLSWASWVKGSALH